MSRPSLLIAAILLFLATTSATAPCSADASPTAEQLAEEGFRLRTQNRDAEALKNFERAYALVASPRYLAQIALAEQALGRWVAAHEHLVAALKHHGDPWISKWQGDLKTMLAKIEGELATLEVTCNVPGTRLVIGGHEVGRTPLAAPVYVAAGTIAIDLQAEGYLPVSHVVNTVRGQLSRIEVELIARTHPGVPKAAEASTPAPMVVATPAAQPLFIPPPELEPPRPASADSAVPVAERRDPRWLYYGVSAGAVVALSSVVTYAVAGKKTDALTEACYDVLCEDDERSERRQKVQALDRATWALAPIGIAAMIGSAAAYYFRKVPVSERHGKSLRWGAYGDASRVIVQGSVEF